MDPHWIAAAFSAVNSIRVVFYVPQIVAVALLALSFALSLPACLPTIVLTVLQRSRSTLWSQTRRHGGHRATLALRRRRSATSV